MTNSQTLFDRLMVELAYCRYVDLAVSETAKRVMAVVERKHLYWGAGEADCPREIKAGNGELHTLRCKVCGQDNPGNSICLPEVQS